MYRIDNDHVCSVGYRLKIISLLKKGQKSKVIGLIALTIRPFLSTFFIIEKGGNGKKVRI